MTNNETLEYTKSCLKGHLESAEAHSDIKEKSIEFAEYCKVIIDVLEQRTPTGNVSKTLSVLKKELEHEEIRFSACLNIGIPYENEKAFKRSLDWYSCCVKALEDYIKGSDKRDK